MRSYKDAYFSIVEEDTLDSDRRELLCAAVLEYENFMIVASCENLLVEVSRSIYAAVAIRPLCILASSNALLSTTEQFLDHAFLIFDADRRFFKVCLDSGDVQQAPQLRHTGFTTDTESKVRFAPGVQGLHPVVRNMVESACAQYDELADLICRLLIGYSFLPDTQLKGKSAGSDLDGLQLHELKAFIDHLNVVRPNFTLLCDDVTNLISHCTTLAGVCPGNAAVLSTTQASAALQNGFPCVYKVMSVFHYLAYQLSMRRKLYSKAFMHIFRAYECYTSGALFGTKAKIANYTSKSGTFSDVYLLDNKRVSGFTAVFKNIGSRFNLLQNHDYQVCKFYIDLRNKFHYTHGDVKPSENLLTEFARSVVRQILKMEKSSNQQNFLWRDIYTQTREILVKDPQIVLPAAIHRSLQAHQLSAFMVP